MYVNFNDAVSNTHVMQSEIGCEDDPGLTHANLLVQRHSFDCGAIFTVTSAALRTTQGHTKQNHGAHAVSMLRHISVLPSQMRLEI